MTVTFPSRWRSGCQLSSPRSQSWDPAEQGCGRHTYLSDFGTHVLSRAERCPLGEEERSRGSPGWEGPAATGGDSGRERPHGGELPAGMWDAPAPLGFCGSRGGVGGGGLASCARRHLVHTGSGFLGPSIPGRVRSVLLRARPRCRNGRAPEPLLVCEAGVGGGQRSPAQGGRPGLQ